jgi:(p)ppGpp synthase/HD superfamily hydrolase
MNHCSSFAQTNVQLFNQLRSEGYAKQEVFEIWKTYEFGMRLFSGLFLPSGKPFLDHLVGTASILTWLHMPVEMVAAGLIHAAYLHGDFGGIRVGVTENKRKEVRKAVGEEVEDYVARYDSLLWNPAKILSIRDTLDELGLVERKVLVVRLANELEHQLDFNGMYYAESEKGQERHQRYMKSYGPTLISMAERLGLTSLAEEMAQVFKDIVSIQVPIEPWIRSKHQVAYLIVPRSYRERFLVRWRRKLSDAFRLCFTIIRRAKRLSCRVFSGMQNVPRGPSQSA